jgi:hypothetical protein
MNYTSNKTFPQNYVLLSPKKDYRKGDIGETQETRKN